MMNPPKRSRFYYLVGQTPVPVDDVLVWAETALREHGVARTIVGDYEVSTVFLGLDHNFFGGEPLLFETMIFPSAMPSIEQEWRARHPDRDLTLRVRMELVEKAQAGLDHEMLRYRERYGTWIGAERGHEKAVREIEKKTGRERTPDKPEPLDDNLSLASETKQDG